VHKGVAAQLLKISPSDPRYLQILMKQLSQDRSEIEGFYVSFAVPEVKEHLRSVTADIVERYDVDGIHLDYIRYASKSFDYSRTALERFRAETEKNLPQGERRLLAQAALADPLIYTAVFPERWAQFLRDQVTDVVERIAVSVRMRKPGVMMTAAVFGDDENAYNLRSQDWKLWLECGLLDALCPMAYTTDTEVFKRQIQKARAFAMGRQIWAGVGAYQMPVEGAVEKIETARAIGVEGIVLFSYDSMVQTSPTNQRCDYLERLKSTVFREPLP
jgi:uncharacterized lipoprotein YddW (UPF0748 family)